MRDEVFIRGNVPMTKSEVRAISLSKLELEADSVLYDVGAGTGSVSVEAALEIPGGMVYAIEQKAEAVELIRLNKARFHVENLIVIPGKAPQAFEKIGSEMPTHALIGGSKGELAAILDWLLLCNSEIRIVIQVIALETLSQAVAWLKKRKIEAEIISVSVARARNIGTYHLMQGQNPVYIITFGGKNDGK